MRLAHWAVNAPLRPLLLAVLTSSFILPAQAADLVTITRDAVDHYMIRKPHHNFFELLKDKLKFGDRYVTGA